MPLRDPGKILLISCYELGRQPLGLVSPLGFLRAAGCRPDAVDLAVSCFDEPRAARAEFIGISVPMHTALRLGVAAARRVREVNPNCHICFYGLYAWLNGEYLLETVADSVIGGEFESPLLALVLANGQHPVPGVWHQGFPATPYLEKLAFPTPSRDGLPALSRYAQLDWQGKLHLVGSIEATRGCLHKCLHCPIPPIYGGRFFVLPQKILLADIAQLVAEGVDHITFADPDFLNGPGHVMDLVRRMHDAHPQLTFDITVKVEHILQHRGVFGELKALGCLFVVSAAESLSDKVLSILEKGHTRTDVFEAIEILQTAGIALRPSLVAFTPWTTLVDYLDVIDSVVSLGLVDHLDPVQLSVRLLVPPGSWLLRRPDLQPHLGQLDQPAFVFRWTHPDPRMDALCQTVGQIVESAASESRDPRDTFREIAAVAHALQDTPSPDLGLYPDQRPPRLTESWFC